MAWAQIGAALVGGAISYLGSKKQNEANRAISQAQMDFQERMSSTAYQRSMEDMKKAGLNPMLAYRTGVSGGVPTGAMAQTPNLGQDFSTAKRVKNETSTMAAQRKNLQAQTANVQADTALKQKTMPQADIINSLNENIVTPMIEMFEDIMGRVSGRDMKEKWDASINSANQRKMSNKEFKLKYGAHPEGEPPSQRRN